MSDISLRRKRFQQLRQNNSLKQKEYIIDRRDRENKQDSMQFLICPTHNKIQKAPHKLTTNCFICMNRYCHQSFIPLCSQCKPDHRDHSNKILTLEDISFLIQRLLKTPFKELSCYIEEAVSAMKKFKLVQENRKRIEQLEREIEREVVGLVEWTEQLVHEYAKCKNRVSELGDLLVNVETPPVFNSLSNRSHQLLSNLEYNYQKDKFEYGNAAIRQKYESRRKSYQVTRRKLQQVKDYSMKIIQVILANEDEDSEGEGDIVYKKKMYQILKKQIYQLYSQNQTNRSQLKSTTNKDKLPHKLNQSQLDIILQQDFILNQNTNTTHNISSLSTTPTKSQPKSHHIPKVLSIQRSSQTSSQWLKSIQQSKKESELKIKKIEQANAKSINQLQSKISMLLRQKQTAKKDCNSISEKYKLKAQYIVQIENKLRANRAKRERMQKQRQSKLQTLIQIANWRTILEGDTIH